MSLHLSHATSRRKHRCPLLGLAWPIVAISVLTAPGCEEEVRHLAKRPETRALDQTGVTIGIDESPHNPAPPQAPTRHPGPIIGQRTTDIKDAAQELGSGRAQVASTKIVKKDPISIHGNAYVSIIGRTSILKIQQAVNLYHAANDRYPKDLTEFLTEIINANNIALPVLPPYQEYGYDEKDHALIILEYSDIKNQPAPR
jgi:hypothetical protein